MARLKDEAIGSKDAFLFDPEKIEERQGYNVRDMDSQETIAHIRKMADSIHANGTISFPPITICQERGRIYVVAGHCRRRAFLLARKEGAPVKGILAIANTQREEDRILDMLNSNDGLPLTQIEKARVIDLLQKFGWTIPEIAKKRGVSEQSIRSIMSILEMPADIKEMVSKGEISATLAIEKTPDAIRKASDGKNAQKKLPGIRKNRITKKDLFDLGKFRPEGEVHHLMNKIYDFIEEMENDEKKIEALKRARSIERFLW